MVHKIIPFWIIQLTSFLARTSDSVITFRLIMNIISLDNTLVWVRHRPSSPGEKHSTDVNLTIARKMNLVIFGFVNFFQSCAQTHPILHHFQLGTNIVIVRLWPSLDGESLILSPLPSKMLKDYPLAAFHAMIALMAKIESWSSSFRRGSGWRSYWYDLSSGD